MIAARPPEPIRMRGALGVAAVVLTLAALASLGAVLAITAGGGTAAPALVWFPLVALPVSFILMAVAITAAVLRRRRL